MFILTGKIQIGDYTFRSIHEVEITKSVEDLVDTAVIKMPSKFKIRQNGELKFTEQTIKPGDKVTITLGYEERYEGVEFVGYVASVGSKIPLEIKCEDGMWQLRRKNINRNFGKTTLKAILQEIVLGTDIRLSDKIPDYPVDKWIIKDRNGTQALQDIKEQLLVSIYLDDDGKLYAGLQQLNNIGQHALYDLNYNLVENNLEYKTEDEKRLRIKYIYIDNKNHKKVVEVGDESGEIRTFHTHVISDENKMREAAKAELKKLKYEGFEGSVKSFLMPYATRGMAAVIQDKEHTNREGRYFIKKVVTTYGMDGARREITISNKI
ncbi:late control protein [Chryseobacterium sp. KCF3-3]|uniref:late control protein n=1 Tax=Chryseobacterium sp. KCF3-3 TaxID=3231511 RepID=UPI0038B23F74